MPTDSRDQRAIKTVACPRCNAWAGSSCYHKGEPTPTRNGRPFCHNERRRAWLEYKHDAEKQYLEEAEVPSGLPLLSVPVNH